MLICEEICRKADSNYFMLKKTFRLNKSSIERIYKRGKTFREGSFLVRFLTNNTDHSRFAVIISKAILPKASARNRLRRMTYIAIEKQKYLKNTDIALTYKRVIEEDKIEGELNKIFQSLGVR